ncbi:MAG TPA: porin family protein [Candidatus Acidoferrum sp.]|nr:porin family protein [Candidatus Acidoferrum sp.]
MKTLHELQGFRQMRLSMIKPAIVAIALACTTTVAESAPGQKSPAEGRIRWGVAFEGCRSKFGGSNADYLSQIPGVTTENHSGVGLGFFLTARLSNAFGVKTELQIAERGAQWNIDGEFLIEDATYLKMNFLLRCGLQSPAKIRPGIFVGPSVAHVVSAEELTNSAISYYHFQDATEAYAPWEFSAVVGAYVEFDLGITDLGLETRYDHGFTHMYKSVPGFAGDFKDRTVSFQVSLRLGRI